MSRSNSHIWRNSESRHKAAKYYEFLNQIRDYFMTDQVIQFSEMNEIFQKYREREKKRVLFLYNETLKRRIGFFRFMKAKIRRQAREISLSFEANVLLALRLKKREKFDWLRFFPMGKRKCLICGEPEPTRKGIFYECTTPGCNFVHCQECWRDVGKICYGCNPIEGEDDTPHEDEDFLL